MSPDQQFVQRWFLLGSRDKLENLMSTICLVLWLVLGKKFWIRRGRGEMSSYLRTMKHGRYIWGFRKWEYVLSAACEQFLWKEMWVRIMREECVCLCMCMCARARACVYMYFFVYFFLPIRELCKICPRFYLCLFLCFLKSPKELNLPGIFYLVLQPKSI